MMPGVLSLTPKKRTGYQNGPAFARGGFALCFQSIPLCLLDWCGRRSDRPWSAQKRLLASYLFAFSCSLGALLWYFFLVRLVSHHQAKFQETTFKKMLSFLALS